MTQIKQGLELKQTQRLSPLQMQTIRLIELPVQELEQRIKSEFEDNPVLDDDAPTRESDDNEPKDVSIDEIDENDPTPSYRLHVNNYGKDERPQYNTFSVKESFTQSLMRQLGFRDLDKHQREVAAFIIGSLDEDGYLRRDLDSLVDDLAFRAGIETTYEEVESLLKVIQEFEPAGVGARDLRECLLLQDQLKAAMGRIVKLNPSPGGQIDDSYNDQAQQIIPDFVLDYNGGQFELSMPRFNIPEIRVNRKYADILENAQYTQDRAQKEAATFVKQKLDSAKWFVEALKQRHNTLEKTMRAILDFQHDYFVDGDESNLRPMVLKDIAERTGFDISTISRVVNSKYIETHFGIFPLKYFFSEGLENQEGEEVSTRELKKALKECIDAEDKRKPLTDDQLVDEMTRRGYKVARRTIAKYRDMLNIPKARLRKEL